MSQWRPRKPIKHRDQKSLSIPKSGRSDNLSQLEREAQKIAIAAASLPASDLLRYMLPAFADTFLREVNGQF